MKEKMVSTISSVPCVTSHAMPQCARKLSIDPSKDYSTPLQVETSVEYDLPAHIYPPKGAKPILMIHPSFNKPKLSVSTPTLSAASSSKPLQVLQMSHNKPTQLTRCDSKLQNSVALCNCGAPQCTVNMSRSRQCSQPSLYLHPNMYHHASKVIERHQQQQQQQQYNDRLSLLQKRLQEQSKQLNLAERIAQTQKEQQQCSSKSATEQLFPWAVNKYQRSSCQPHLVAAGSSGAEFLAPSLPSSLLARTTTRGISGGSPKLRARSRRGISVANNANLPDYLGLARPSRSAGAGTVLQSHVSQRSRSTAPIANLHGPTEYDLFKSSFTPSHNTLFHSNKPAFNQSTNSILSTVGQSIDSGCSLGGDVILGSSNMPLYYNTAKTMDRYMVTPSIIDSGFSTPVDTSEDAFMECLESVSRTTPTTVRNVAYNTSVRENVWAKEQPSTQNIFPSNSSVIHNALLSQSNLHHPHYYNAPPLFNLAY